ncbi:hypothetical protein P280DRAFT_468378 [Massarina eburnea CBS 473.64]|uniref:L-dopachrome isomerase n=1 Tax=Massarina eburnea CBS 473.64 TaxID=1395130 RepID=A0A6A6S2X5_9PLEO|nr:hypothetical protein P280DRAFT_468378 [Massarina eburnea CBS 473.64]
MPHAVTEGSTPNTMSRPSSTSTYSANAFPRPAGATLLAPEAIGEHLSPSRSTFSFDSSPKSVQGSEHAVHFDDAQTNRPATAATAVRNSGPAAATAAVQQNGGGSRRRAQYYAEQFAYKDDTTSSARDRVTKDAPIVAELRTNVIIKDEYTLVTDLSHHLSTRYQRPESSIMITVNHSACLLLAGSFEPCYVLSITALPIQLQPTTNKRNAALIQNFMFESIGVPSDRGIVKFMPIEAECIATNGATIQGEIDRMERLQVEENGGLKRALTKNSRRSAVTKAKSSFQLSRSDSKANAPVRTVVTPPIPSPGPFDSGVAVDQANESAPPTDSKLNRKSSMKRKASKKFNEKETIKSIPQPPPIPEDNRAPKISKRKSFVSIFRR